MRITTIIQGIAATALLGSFSAAQAVHVPTPCEAGQPGAGTNCIYLVLNGTTTPEGGYNSTSGDRADASASLSYGVDVWIDFRTADYTGGGMSIMFDTTGVSGPTSFTFNPTVEDPPLTNEGSFVAGFGHTDIQFNDAGGFNSLLFIGTLNVTASAPGVLDFMITIGDETGAYGTSTFPSCFAAASGSTCAGLGLYDLTVTAVPLPAAVWLMIAGIGSLAGFSRRKAA